MSETITITSFRGKYEVRFVGDFASSLEASLREGDVLIIDSNVAALYASQLASLTKGWRHFLITPTEEQKSYAAVGSLLEELIAGGLRKNHRLVAIGGGITQDVTAFAASLLFRGTDWIFVPTNLLSQGDSCIGSKTSINVGRFKNQVGGFHSPRLILIDTRLLKTLPRRELLSGLGEMAHYFLISGEADFERFSRDAAVAETNGSVLEALIRRSLEIKKAMVEIDEFDQGPRNVFNYGHSFGHALESVTRFAVPHGLAVAYGMDLANAISVHLGLLQPETRLRVRAVLSKLWASVPPPRFEIADYLDALRKDKKNQGREVRVILTRGMGDMFLTKLEITPEIESLIAAFWAEHWVE